MRPVFRVGEIRLNNPWVSAVTPTDAAEKTLLTPKGSNICMNATPFRVGEIMLNNPWVSLGSPTAIELHPFGMKPRCFPILEFQTGPVPRFPFSSQDKCDKVSLVGTVNVV